MTKSMLKSLKNSNAVMVPSSNFCNQRKTMIKIKLRIECKTIHSPNCNKVNSIPVACHWRTPQAVIQKGFVSKL